MRRLLARRLGRWSVGRWLIVGVVAVIVVHVSVVAAYGLIDVTPRADVAVVLGNEILSDGRASPRLAARVERGVELWKSGTVPALMMSGGTSRTGFYEARVMTDLAVSLGVPRDAIVVDNAGVDTWSTAENTRALLEARKWTRAIVVSSFSHLLRCDLAFEKNGVTLAGRAHARFFEVRDLYAIMREVLGLYAYAAFKDARVD